MNILVTRSIPSGLRFLLAILFFTASLQMLWFQNADAESGQEYYLYGSLCNYSGGSATSSTLRLTFDGRGNFWFDSEYSYSGGLNDQYGIPAARYGGYGSSQVNSNPTGRYTVRGRFVILHDGSGDHQFWIHMRQNDGRITEILGAQNKTLYAVGLCD